MCSPRKSDENFSILTFLWIKTNVAYTRLEVIAKQRSALQVEFITGVKLICYFVLCYCFLHWSHLPNMAVGDLAFYYTLYLWSYYDSTCALAFQPRLLVVARMFYHEMMTPAFQYCLTKDTRWHHVHSQSGIKFSQWGKSISMDQIWT